MPKARAVMSKPVVTMEPTTPLGACLQVMAERRIGAVVVCDAGRPIGLFSERDLVSRVVTKGRNIAQLVMRDVMTAAPCTADADDDLDSVFSKMRSLEIRHVPVVQEGLVVGMISIRDLIAGGHPSGQRTQVGTWMTTHPLTASENDTVQIVSEAMTERSVGSAVVVRGEEVVGLITDRDVLNKVVARRLSPAQMAVHEIMTSAPAVAKVEDEFEAVYETLSRLTVRHLPVVSQGKLVGIVSMRDVFRFKERILERLVAEKSGLLATYQSALDHDGRINHLLLELDRMKSQAITDELTGLNNRRYFQNRMEEEFSRARRYQRRLSIALCDIDRFKQLNDAYGHPGGDDVLSDVAKLLQNSLKVQHMLTSFRRSDVVIRFGGEEFVIIFPETDEKGAYLACERVRKTIAGFPFLSKRLEKPIQVTMSFGVASFPVHSSSSEDLVACADEALYVAKNSGRNRVMIVSRPVPATK